MKKEAFLYEKLTEEKVRCKLCSHQCIILPNNFGICGVRKNEKGILYTLVYQEAISVHIDPIEKKPLYHFLPASFSFSFATVGCNFKCGFCQNWQISQLDKRKEDSLGFLFLPEEIVKRALENSCLSISYTYSEPTIFFEYAYETAKLAKEKGLYNVFVTNGYMTKEAIEMIKPYLDAVNVDLKAFNDNFYQKICRAKLLPVLENIRYMKQLGIWVEITTLVIPGENDKEEEFKKIAEFIANIDKEIPWHISRFYPQYQFLEKEPTPIRTLKKAKEIGEMYGLKYIYLGNVAEENNTYCPHCHKLLIERIYFDVRIDKIERGYCGYCGYKIPGLFL